MGYGSHFIQKIGSWNRAKQSEQFHVFGFFTLAALNQIEESSAAQRIMLFRRGLFGQKEAFNVGVFSGHVELLTIKK